MIYCIANCKRAESCLFGWELPNTTHNIYGQNICPFISYIFCSLNLQWMFYSLIIVYMHSLIWQLFAIRVSLFRLLVNMDCVVDLSFAFRFSLVRYVHNYVFTVSAHNCACIERKIIMIQMSEKYSQQHQQNMYVEKKNNNNVYNVNGMQWCVALRFCIAYGKLFSNMKGSHFPKILFDHFKLKSNTYTRKTIDGWRKIAIQISTINGRWVNFKIFDNFSLHTAQCTLHTALPSPFSLFPVTASFRYSLYPHMNRRLLEYFRRWAWVWIRPRNKTLYNRIRCDSEHY